MEAKIVTYTTEKLNPTQRSILSKKLNGYIDKSNKARYTYKRKGILQRIEHIKITNKAIIVKKEDFLRLTKELKKYGANIKYWDIEIKTF